MVCRSPRSLCWKDTPLGLSGWGYEGRAAGSGGVVWYDGGPCDWGGRAARGGRWPRESMAVGVSAREGRVNACTRRGKGGRKDCVRCLETSRCEEKARTAFPPEALKSRATSCPFLDPAPPYYWLCIQVTIIAYYPPFQNDYTIPLRRHVTLSPPQQLIWPSASGHLLGPDDGSNLNDDKEVFLTVAGLWRGTP